MGARRTAGQRAGLGREAVLAAARDVVSAKGIEALTMRALAERLGVRPNTLYSHVSSKAALVEALLDGVLAEVRTPADGVEWRAGLHELMRSTYDVLLAHPDLVPLYLGRGSRGENAQRLGEVVLGLLDRGGVTDAPAREALHVLIVYTIGFAAFATQPGFEGQDAGARLADLSGNFDSGLGWLIEGIGSGDGDDLH